MRRIAAAVLSLALLAAPAAGAPVTVNDITQLNPVSVEAVAQPRSVEELRVLVAGHAGPVSIGDARHSQGGQIACAGCLFIDMRGLNRVLALDAKSHRVTVQAGMTWRELQEALDPQGLAVAIMQDYANFTVGGTLSVDAHGAYPGLGPVVDSVRSFRIVLADGSLVTASREENPDIFFGAIGGYGGLGVIVEATLDVADNEPLERVTTRMKVADYAAFYRDHVEHDPQVIMHSAAIYPPDYRVLVSDSLMRTDRSPTNPARLASRARPSPFDLLLIDLVTWTDIGKHIRACCFDPHHPRGREVEWRNFVASQDANGIEPPSRKHSTYALQEYFVPVEAYGDFTPRMAAILKRRHANVLNLAIRHVPPETGTLLNWAPKEMFCFVLYYQQGVTPAARARVKAWTAELIQLSIDEGGDWYLPYQIVATREQFLKAYPRAPELFALKRRLDPTYKFRNSLWEAYYTP